MRIFNPSGCTALAAAVAILAGLALASPGRAAASPDAPPGTGTIGIGANLCLTASGSAVIIAACDATPAQAWHYTSRDEAVRLAGQCLNVTGGSDVLGTQVGLADCDGSPRQHWVIHPNGQIVSAKSATCLQPAGGTLTAGTGIVIAACAGGTAQTWTTALGGTPAVAMTASGPTEFDWALDTPVLSFTDTDGTFYAQQSVSLYNTSQYRWWQFYTGQNFDDLTEAPISNAVNPANPADSNADTTWRCDTSPTGLEATYDTGAYSTHYLEKNYCDLVGVWVDPDTGDWYGVVHDEFTPSPYGDQLHFDSIDYAVSADHGATWKILGHAVTSPYPTERGNTAAFPNQTYDYGDGDPRLYVDYSSGYFYLFYMSRVVGKTGSATVTEEHVARAPIKDKMAAGSWTKYYEGSWSQPGLGGKESELTPTTPSGTGYIATADDYSPSDTGTVPDLISNGDLRTTPIQDMVVSWDPYLGAYIGLKGGTFYEAASLATEKWVDIGSPADYQMTGYYQSMTDSGSLTGQEVLGSSFRVYCTGGCKTYPDYGEYSTVTLDRTTAQAPSEPVVSGRSYQITSGGGRRLAQTGGSSAGAGGPGDGAAGRWTFTSDADGFYTVTNARSGLALGVNSSSSAGRAWGAAAGLSPSKAGDTGQEWAVQPHSGGGFRLINRYSGLVLSLGPGSAVTGPVRSWNAAPGAVGGFTQPVNAQLFTFTPAP